MIIRPAQVRTIPSFLLPSLQQSSYTQLRSIHGKATTNSSKIPEPTPFVPDVKTFLTVIGRNLSQHTPKIPTWSALFSLTSPQLKELGIEPPRSRRYLLRWRENFRQGKFGIGGDAKTVVDGAVPLQVVDVPVASASSLATTAGSTKGYAKTIVNLPLDSDISQIDISTLDTIKIQGVKIKGLHTIVGPHVKPVRGGENGKLAKIEVKEGLWEDRRGRVIDGGERRRAEVRAKRRGEERKTTRTN